jgi:hypothetical protein
LPVSGSDPVPLPVLDAVAHQLESSGIAYCQIRLEHNVAPLGGTVVLTSPPATTCDCQTDDSLASSPGGLVAPTQYVRLTICVPLSQVFPKSLSFFGEQLYGPEKTYEQTAIYRYELETP